MLSIQGQRRNKITRVLTLWGMVLVLGVSAIIGVARQVVERAYAATPVYSLGASFGHPNYFYSPPRGIAGTPDGGFLITSGGISPIEKFNAAGVYQFGFSNQGASSPVSITTDSVGTIYTIEVGNNDSTCNTGMSQNYCVKKYTASGGYLATLNFPSLVTSSELRSIAIDSQGMLYLESAYYPVQGSYTAGLKIDKFDTSGGFIQSIATSSLAGGLLQGANLSHTSMTIANDVLYSADGTSVQTFDLTGHFLRKMSPGSGGYADATISGAFSVAVDSDGTIAVIDTGCSDGHPRGCVKYFSQNGDYIGKTVDPSFDGALAAAGSGFYATLYASNGGFAIPGSIKSVGLQGLNQTIARGNGDASLSATNILTTDTQGNVYVYDSSNLRIQKFNHAGDFLLTIPWNNPYSSGQCSGVAVDNSGNIYAIVYTAGDYRCHIQKFDATGAFVSQSGALSTNYESHLTTDGTGRLYTSSTINYGGATTLTIYTLSGAITQTVTNYGGTAAWGIKWLAYGAGKLYALDDNGLYQLDADGANPTQLVDLASRSPTGLAVDVDGNIYTSAQSAPYSSQYLAYKYSPTSTLITSFSLPFASAGLAVDTQGSLFTMGYKGPQWTNTVYRYDAGFIYAPASAPTNVTISAVERTGAVVSWDALAGTPTYPVTKYQVRLRAEGTTSDLFFTSDANSTTLNAFGLAAGTTYAAYVSAGNDDGYGPEATAAFRTQDAMPKFINAATLSTVNNQKLLTVAGTNLLEGGDTSFFDALNRSLVTLNGVSLPFCSQYGFGMTAQAMIDTYSAYYPNLPQTISDNPPCYELLDSSYNALITDTQAIILLPESFNTTAQGTVSVNGSPTYTFNRTPDAPPVAYVNGTKPITQHPTVPLRPTFSGTATPNAHIVVTVHSDPVVCEATADANGNWSCTLPVSLPAGEHTVYVKVTNPDNSVITLGPYGVTAGVITNMTPKAPNTGIVEMVRQHRERQAIVRNEGVLMSVGVGLLTTIVGVGVLFTIVRRLRVHHSEK